PGSARSPWPSHATTGLAGQSPTVDLTRRASPAGEAASGEHDVLALDLDLLLRERAAGRPRLHRPIRDRERAAVAGADDHIAVDAGHRASLVRADVAEGLELPLGRLRDHHALLREDLASADRDVPRL